MSLSVRRRPEAAVLGGVAVAWAVMGAAHWSLPNGRVVPGVPGGAAEATTLLWSTVARAWPLWIVMSIAMMAPAALPAVRHVAVNSFRWRRHRAVATFLLVYQAAWAAFGLVALVGLTAWNLSVGSRLSTRNGPLVAALAIVVVWQLTPSKRRHLRGCQKSIPLAPRGWRAFGSCARFGAQYGARCIGSCWAVMLVMVTATAGHLWWTAALTAVVVAERSVEALRQRPQLLAVAGMAAAAILAFTGSAGDPTSGSEWFCTISAV